MSKHILAALIAVTGVVGCSSEESDPTGDAVDMTVDMPAPEFGFQIVTEPRVVLPGAEAKICSVVQSVAGVAALAAAAMIFKGRL